MDARAPEGAMGHERHATEPLFPACEAGRMSAYKVVNLLELDDVVGERAPGLEGRFARKHLESRDLGISHWRYSPNFRSPASHKHGEQEEAYIVLSGSGRVRLDDAVVDLRQWDVVRVAPEVVRGFEAGPDGMQLIAVGGPRPEEGDGQQTDDPWPGEA
jgi:mannose-6-phosphate isomerase-like protein (cupin superfamily)